MKIMYYFVILILSACSESSFDGKNPNQGNQDANSGENQGGENNTSTNTDLSTNTGYAECKINLNYKPDDLQCSIPAKESNNIWMNTPPWKTHLKSFTDESANWISPLAPIIDPSTGRRRCPEVSASNRLVYVSHFKVTPGEHSLEVMVDNSGTLQLWQNSDPNKVDLDLPLNDSIGKRTINLTASSYAIVMNSLDGGIAAAGILSIRDSSGQVVKRTTTDGSWCVFRVPADVDVKDYVLKAASCRSCFIGEAGK